MMADWQHCHCRPQTSTSHTTDTDDTQAYDSYLSRQASEGRKARGENDSGGTGQLRPPMPPDRPLETPRGTVGTETQIWGQKKFFWIYPLMWYLLRGAWKFLSPKEPFPTDILSWAIPHMTFCHDILAGEASTSSGDRKKFPRWGTKFNGLNRHFKFFWLFCSLVGKETLPH